MKTLDEIIEWMTSNDDQSCNWCREKILPALEALRDAGVFVAKGSRAWAVAMVEAGHGVKCPTSNTLRTLKDVAVFGWKCGWELAPPAEREVPPWDACRAWHEGKEVRYSDIGWHKKGKSGGCPFYFTGTEHTWFIREPEGGK